MFEIPWEWIYIFGVSCIPPILQVNSIYDVPSIYDFDQPHWLNCSSSNELDISFAKSDNPVFELKNIAEG